MLIPYDIIKQAVFEVNKSDLIDIPHCARLQYNLLKLDAIIKAKVEYNKALITIIYNPKSAENEKNKIDLNEIKQFLEKQGIKIKDARISEKDYDYYNKFYLYAFNPKQIRYHPPYGSKK
ncbi:hypothetical protein M1278_02725 [Candidatus Marsarchaeota archaeon]|nr:hypothetical protein [Candidatus Marsarchaeota archaeon]